MNNSNNNTKNKKTNHPEDSLSFEERVEHLSAGYSNSQSVVRFLDTKAAAVIGCVPILLGILAAVTKWQQEVLPMSQLRDSIGISMAVFIVLTLSLLAMALLFLATRAITLAFNAISPRGTGESKPSMLFPYSSKCFEDRLSHFMGRPSRTDVLNDYRRQLDRMSEITSAKLTCVNDAIRHLKWMFWLGLPTAALMLTVVVGSSLVSLSNSKTSSLDQAQASSLISDDSVIDTSKP